MYVIILYNLLPDYKQCSADAVRPVANINIKINFWKMQIWEMWPNLRKTFFV